METTIQRNGAGCRSVSPLLRRRKEKIVRLYPILFVVTQALQHAEWTNQLQVRETNFFENFASCRCFERFA